MRSDDDDAHYRLVVISMLSLDTTSPIITLKINDAYSILYNCDTLGKTIFDIELWRIRELENKDRVIY